MAPVQTTPVAGSHTEIGDQPNILIVLVDDVGHDMLAVYDSESEVACTPTIDALAERGMVFHNAWSNPLCSPSRAQILTGRYAYRNGVGSNAGRWQDSTGLPTGELSMPEVLPQYQSAWVGKWHLAHPVAADGELTHPNDTGFDYFAGPLFNLVHGPVGSDFDYFEWEKTVNGVEFVTTEYATSDTAEETIFAANTLQEPWLIVASFNAPHAPRHNPPARLITCDPATQNAEARKARRMLNAMDTEFSRILNNIDPNAYVFFMGDNGSARDTILPPYDPQHGKGTMYEGGINVPLIVVGPGVPQGNCDNLVSSTDLFATVAELSGGSAYAEDSISFLPYLNGATAPLRDTIYTERFAPNGYQSDFETHQQAVRTLRYKLIVSTEAPDEFYDLEVDPLEQDNLMGNLSNREQRAYEALSELIP
jgi:arylsulfatase A-like enzyme